MGKSAPKPPAAPDPAKTAAAQTASNKETAYWNAALNNVNQVTPYGNLTYAQTAGGKKYNEDAYNAAMAAYNAAPATATRKIGNFGSGRGVATGIKKIMPKREDYLLSDTPPQFTSTVDLSPESQQLLDTQMRSDNALASLGEGQIGRIGQAVSDPYSFAGLPQSYSGADIQGASTRGEEALMSRLNPRFAQDEEALRTRLVNQGIGLGSEAYGREMDLFNNAKNDARMQAVLQGANYGGVLQDQSLRNRNQAIQEYNTQRNAPLNEYVALTSGQQVQNPNFMSTGYQGAQGVDYAGLVNQQYQGNLNAYNQKIASGNSTKSALFGLAGAAAGGFLGNPALGAKLGWAAGTAGG